MKTETYRFKKGKMYHVDETSYILSGFGNCFKNVDAEGNDEDMSDNQICLEDCEITIKVGV